MLHKKTILFLYLIGISLLGFTQNDTTSHKKIYTKYVGEIIFQFTDTDIKNQQIINGVRTTFFTNYSLQTHFDYSRKFGIIPGLSIRNIGIKTKNTTLGTTTYDKIKQRAMLFGGSLAVKFGNFDKHFFAYAGGEYELAFHYRQKLYSNKSTIKQGEWFSNASEQFLPSVFVGIQLPKGVNLQLKYYLKDFINNNYNHGLGDFTQYTKSKLICLAFSLQFNDSKIDLLKDTQKKEPIEL